MIYGSSRCSKARSVLPISSILCVISINYETLKCFREHSLSSERCLPNNKHLAGSSSPRPTVVSVPSSLQAWKWKIHRWCNMGNGRAEGHKEGSKRENSRLQNSGDHRLLQEWRPAAPGVETSCSRVKKGAPPCLWYALHGVVLLSSDLRALEFQTVRGFICTGVAI